MTFFASLPKPEPAGSQLFYAYVKQRAIDRSRRTQENWLKYQNAGREAEVDYLPVKLDLENVSRCNFQCKMCEVSSWPKMTRAADMPLECFKRIIDEQYGVLEIKIQGLGEPTMGGDNYFEMIRYARAQPLWVRTTTNASRLHLKDYYAKLIDADPCEIQISIDGATKETFEKIRVGGNFERVCRNCQLVNAYDIDAPPQWNLPRRRTKMWTVVQEDNQHELEALVELAGELGFDNQVFSLDVSGFGDAEWEERNRKIDVSARLEERRLLDLVERGKELGIKVAFWTVGHKFETGSPDTICSWPFERSFISSDLRVVPCCIISNPDTFQIGAKLDDKANAFTDVWHGEGYRAFRMLHLVGQIPPACQNCYRGGGNGTE
jgi:MoaA/NifB/PqqE/SkfB family radical SAM enzyme